MALDQPDDVTRVALEVLREETRSSVVGFLWIDEAERLRPKLIIPDGSTEPVNLSHSLTELVCRQGRAVWIAKQQADKTSESLLHYADAICVPLIHQEATLGALHIYLDRGRFQERDFEMAIATANIMVVALVRARQRSSLETDYQRLAAQAPGHSELIGDSPAMRELKERINRVARTNGCVLIRGESGAGKELVARAIHRASPRADRPLLSVNFAAIPGELMESQLFGHKTGSFTGADRDHVGFFQQADSGTLFLDEVGELTWEGQAKLLRILEGHPFLPVGAQKQVTVDVRVIAATNQDLQNYVRQRKFRDDLFYRLTVLETSVPPLRDRDADLAQLLDFFFDHFRRQHGRPSLTLSPRPGKSCWAIPGPATSASSQRGRQCRSAGRRKSDRNRRSACATRRWRAQRSPSLFEAQAHRRIPAPHLGQRPRSRQTARPRPGHPLPQDRRIWHRALSVYSGNMKINDECRTNVE